MSNYSKPQFNPEPMVNKLSALFRTTTRALGNAPILKELQVTFMYFVDEIQRGPVYDASKLSVFVLHWVQKIEAAAALDKSDRDAELNRLKLVTYQHQNFFI